LGDAAYSHAGILGRMRRSRRFLPSYLLAVLGAAAACGDPANPLPDHCFIFVAAVSPAFAVLDIGETLTMHAAFDRAPECLPADTTAAGVRWSSTTPASVAIDPVTAHVTALSPGWSEIYVHPVASQETLGLTWVYVREPASADTLISIIQNTTPDSATVVLEDASGTVVRSQTVGANSALCWNTALADSVRYSALVFFPTAPAGIKSTGAWVTKRALSITHTWIITVTTTAPSTPAVLLQGVTPDRGC
jgi:hypothetical protein